MQLRRWGGILLGLMFLVSCTMPLGDRAGGLSQSGSLIRGSGLLGLSHAEELLTFAGRHVLVGGVEWPQADPPRRTQADPAAVIGQATISLIDYISGLTVASSITDIAGAFTLNTGTYVPPVGSYHLLEASKGLVAQLPGNQAVRMRTLVQWNGSGWLSITNGVAPGSIRIHQLTTAITLEIGLGRITPIGAIDTVDLVTPPGLKVASIQGITGSEILNLSADVKAYVVANLDPVAQTNAIAPALASLTPATGAAGTTVAIAGSGFVALAGGTTATFGGVAAANLVITPSNLYVQVPVGTPTGAITVVVNTPRGGASNGLTFTVPPPVVVSTGAPVVSGVSPNPTAADKLITFYGKGFLTPATSNTVVFTNKLGGTISPVAADYLAGTADSVTVKIPTNAGTGLAYVTNANGTSASFVVDLDGYAHPTGPTIDSIFPTTGSSFQQVMLFGSRFGATLGTVKVGGIVASATDWSDTFVRFIAPAGLGAGAQTIEVSNSLGAAGSAGWATVNGDLAVGGWVSTGYTALNLGYVPSTLVLSKNKKLYIVGGGPNSAAGTSTNNISSLTLNDDGSPASFAANIATTPFVINQSDMQGTHVNWVGRRGWAFQGAGGGSCYLNFDAAGAMTTVTTDTAVPITLNEHGGAAGPRGIYAGFGYANFNSYYKKYNLSTDVWDAGWSGPYSHTGGQAEGAQIVLGDRLWYINISGFHWFQLGADGAVTSADNFVSATAASTGWPGPYMPNLGVSGNFLYTIHGWTVSTTSEMRRSAITGGNAPATLATWPTVGTANLNISTSGSLIAIGKYFYKVGGGSGSPGDPVQNNIFYTPVS